MKQKTYISIPQPCHENWAAMTPHDKGRFCQSCAKTVVDFSVMSDAQVLHYLNNSKGRQCGRFAPDQLERALQPIQIEKKKVWWMAALMPVMLLVTKANAQKNTQKTVFEAGCNYFGYITGKINLPDTASNNVIIKLAEKTLSGKIIDNDNIPIQGASVSIKGYHIGTVTDSAGNFTLHFSSSDTAIEFTIAAIASEAKELNVSYKNLNEVNIGTIILNQQSELMGAVIVMAGRISIHHPIKKIDTIKTTIRKAFYAPAFTVYPNPAQRGSVVNIDVKKAGNYSVHLLNNNSKLITNAVFDAVKNATNTALHIPSSAAAGMYFIRLVNDDTKKQYTEKIIIK